jgi:hypothetical protein
MEQAYERLRAALHERADIAEVLEKAGSDESC